MIVPFKPFILILALVGSGCAMPRAMFAPSHTNVALVQGPPIADVRTGFDDALSCLRGQIPKEVIFAVGQVVDSTGKENYSEGGAGKYVTQGAGEMVQSALFRAGVSVVNRRDSSITINEANWGIRDIKRQLPVNFYISGSINSLDFIPGGGAEATISGIGPRYRENRMLIALDLSMTDAYTGRVVASVPMQKQIFTNESGIGLNTFFGSTLVQLDAGGMQREALHFALRQMLSLASFELLGQIMPRDVYSDCRARIEEGVGESRDAGLADAGALTRAIAETKKPAAPTSQNNPAPKKVAGVAPSAPQARSRGELLGEQANKAATLAIKAAHESEAAADRKTAVTKAAESLQLANLALRALKEAAAAGFAGEEGEVSAVVVQQALQAAQRAGTAAAGRVDNEKAPVTEEQGLSAAAPTSPKGASTDTPSAASAAAATEAEAKPGGRP